MKPSKGLQVRLVLATAWRFLLAFKYSGWPSAKATQPAIPAMVRRVTRSHTLEIFKIIICHLFVIFLSFVCVIFLSFCVLGCHLFVIVLSFCCHFFVIVVVILLSFFCHFVICLSFFCHFVRFSNENLEPFRFFQRFPRKSNDFCGVF